MKGKFFKRLVSVAAVLSVVISMFAITPIEVCATTANLEGIQYQFSKDCKYVLDEALAQTDISGKTQFGTISIDGNVTRITAKNGMQAYQVSDGRVTIKYNVDTQLTVIDDKIKTVAGATVDSNILKGAIIVQSSLDGEKWITDNAITNMASSDSGFDSFVYETNEVQQTNGCYFRVIVAYKTEKLLEQSNIWIVDTSDYETMRWAEIYKFYLVDKDQGQQTTSNTSKRKVFQDIEYRTKTEKDKGYTGVVDETVDDPHYGWNLGDFIINGYTEDELDADGTPIIYKNAGDQVTLWYSLKEDIDRLQGKDYLFINEDKEGWDEYFNIPKTNFRKGTLIIRQTDADGEANDPVIFTNFLEANVRTGADTKVRLFEEGDYEVALDYEIKNTDPIIDEVTNYRVFFKFKIRNSNCMIFPFDITTQSELKDRDISETGFRLDYAESKYLVVNVEYQAVTFNGTSYVADTRENKVATNGREYTKEGIYIISVENKTKNSRTTEKTIYVGTAPIIKALSKNNITIDDVNELIRQGYTIDEDGGLVSKANEVVEEENEETDSAAEESSNVEKATEATTSAAVEKTSGPEIEEPKPTEESDAGLPVVVYVLIATCMAVILGVIIWKNTSKKKDIQLENVETTETADSEAKETTDTTDSEDKEEE